jgi:hypothetical protein
LQSWFSLFCNNFYGNLKSVHHSSTFSVNNAVPAANWQRSTP